MPGHDKSRIVGIDQAQLDELTCSICQDVLNNPVVTQCCGQSYCKDCITEWLTKEDSCPNDRQRLTTDGLTPVPRFVNNMIGNMKMKCEFSGKGCEEVVAISQMIQHLKVCDYSKCKKCGFIDTELGHDCLTYLLDKHVKAGDEMDKLNSANAMLTNLNKNLMSTEILIKNENKNLKSQLTMISNELAQARGSNMKVKGELLKSKNELAMLKNQPKNNDQVKALNKKINEYQREIKQYKQQLISCQASTSKVDKSLSPPQAEMITQINELKRQLEHYKSVSIPMAIMSAKQVDGTVEQIMYIDVGLAERFKNVCQGAIDDFDIISHTNEEFIDYTRARISEISSRPEIYWMVHLFVNEAPDDWRDMIHLLKLKFNNLIIVIGGKHI